ncbi:uncharacterized protein LOC126667352 [Mercurialis annua]|uniref:uncharacterized protein LOC126667352 n=1 Tax=Mercurialis annua TaxID=3986 RepID=UPI00215F9316|nr:uncharacterized protein LOC126667352 [Mercurialis annua]
MSRSSSLACLFVLFSLAIIEIHAREPIPFPRYKFEFHIIKGYADGVILGLCTSPNQQFRANFTLTHLDEQYQHHFMVSRHFHVLYGCSFVKGHSNEKKSFSVFDQSVDTHVRRCGHTGMCFWKLKQDGIYFANDNVSYTKEFAWDSYI